MIMFLWYMLYKVKNKMQIKDLNNVKLINFNYKSYVEILIFKLNCRWVMGDNNNIIQRVFQEYFEKNNVGIVLKVNVLFFICVCKYVIVLVFLMLFFFVFQ